MRAATTTAIRSQSQSKRNIDYFGILVSAKMKKYLVDITKGAKGMLQGIMNAIKQGRTENMTKDEIRIVINTALGKAGYSDRHIRRTIKETFPELIYDEMAREQPKVKNLRSSMSANRQEATDEIDNKYRNEIMNSSVSNVQTTAAVMVEPKDFNPDRLWDYPIEFLIEVVQYLHKENLLLKEKLAHSSGSSRNHNFATYEEALKYARIVALNGVNTDRKWREHCKSSQCPANIPSRPDKVYAGKGWSGWGPFFGK